MARATQQKVADNGARGALKVEAKTASKDAPKTAAPNGAGNGSETSMLAGNHMPDLTVMVQSSEAFLDGMTKLSAEMFTFTTHRLQESVRISEAFSQCRDITEALEVQRDYVQHASEEYLQEANRIMALTADMTRAAWSPLQEQATETVTRATDSK